MWAPGDPPRPPSTILVLDQMGESAKNMFVPAAMSSGGVPPQTPSLIVGVGMCVFGGVYCTLSNLFFFAACGGHRGVSPPDPP